MEPETATVFDIDNWYEKLGIALIINDGEVTDVVIELKTTAKSCTS